MQGEGGAGSMGRSMEKVHMSLESEHLGGHRGTSCREQPVPQTLRPGPPPDCRSSGRPVAGTLGKPVSWEMSSGEVWRAILAGDSRRKGVPNQLVAKAGSGLGS